MLITPEDIQEYNENGAIIVRDVLSREAAEQMVKHIERHMDFVDSSATARFEDGAFQDRYLWPSEHWMKTFCIAQRLPEIAGKCMQSETARLYFDHIFVREVGTSSITPWHQDRPYWPFLGEQIASVWVALTDVPKEASGMQFVRGSHKWGKIFKPTQFGNASGKTGFLAKNDARDEMPDIENGDFDILSWDMKAGDAVIFGGEVIHGAQGNTSPDARRIAISVRYVGEQSRWDPRPGTDPIVSANDVSIQPGDAPEDDIKFPLVWRRG